MGQLGPVFTQHRDGFFRRIAPVGLYGGGVMVSSGFFLFGVDLLVGGYSRRVFDDRLSLLVAAAAAGALLVVDAVRMWGGRHTSWGPTRQTPYRWRMRGAVGTFGWGIDTGLPISTVRATSLPLLGVILVGAGFGSPFHGLAYGLGLTLGVFAALPRQQHGEDIRTEMDQLLRRYRNLGLNRLVLAPSGLTAAVLLASSGALHF